MPTGKVKFYREDSGYGLIEPDDGGKDVSVHVTSVADPSVEIFREDRRVRYVKRVSQRSGNPEEGVTAKARALALAKTTKFAEKRDAATLGGPGPASAATPHPKLLAWPRKPLWSRHPNRIQHGARQPARRNYIANWSALRKPTARSFYRTAPKIETGLTKTIEDQLGSLLGESRSTLPSGALGCCATMIGFQPRGALTAVHPPNGGNAKLNNLLLHLGKQHGNGAPHVRRAGS